MATLSVASYTSEKKQGFWTLTIATTGNHNLAVEYLDITITGATDTQYNGTFRFQVINATTLKYSQGVEIGILQTLTTVSGTILANTIDYTTLTAENIDTNAFLYKIATAGNYQILLSSAILYKLDLREDFQNIKIGERLSDADRILYAKESKPKAIYKAKWLILEVSGMQKPIEVRLIKLN